MAKLDVKGYYEEDGFVNEDDEKYGSSFEPIVTRFIRPTKRTLAKTLKEKSKEGQKNIDRIRIIFEKNINNKFSKILKDIHDFLEKEKKNIDLIGISFILFNVHKCYEISINNNTLNKDDLFQIQKIFVEYLIPIVQSSIEFKSRAFCYILNSLLMIDNLELGNEILILLSKKIKYLSIDDFNEIDIAFSFSGLINFEKIPKELGDFLLDLFLNSKSNYSLQLLVLISKGLHLINSEEILNKFVSLYLNIDINVENVRGIISILQALMTSYNKNDSIRMLVGKLYSHICKQKTDHYAEIVGLFTILSMYNFYCDEEIVVPKWLEESYNQIKFNNNPVNRTEHHIYDILKNSKWGKHTVCGDMLDGIQMDFYIKHKKLNIEIDGFHHNYKKQKMIRRDKYLYDKYGITVVRVSLKDVDNIRSKINEIISSKKH